VVRVPWVRSYCYYLRGNPPMTKYRVMVEGEDGTLFCYDNDLLLEEIDPVMAEAWENYPNASIMVESYDQVKTF